MKRIIILAILLLLSPHAYAGDMDSVEIDDVTVTATKTPRKLEEVSAAVDVVTKEDIENSRGWNVGETIGKLTGVQSESKNGGYDTQDR